MEFPIYHSAKYTQFQEYNDHKQQFIRDEPENKRLKAFDYLEDFIKVIWYTHKYS